MFNAVIPVGPDLRRRRGLSGQRFHAGAASAGCTDARTTAGTTCRCSTGTRRRAGQKAGRAAATNAVRCVRFDWDRDGIFPRLSSNVLCRMLEAEREKKGTRLVNLTDEHKKILILTVFLQNCRVLSNPEVGYHGSGHDKVR
jgi:hypothetical protein